MPYHEEQKINVIPPQTFKSRSSELWCHVVLQ